MLSLCCSLNRVKRGRRAPCCSTKSRHCGLSPAIFPSAHTACSLTSRTEEDNNLMNSGTAPALITTCVCSAVPEAILVRAQAASNCQKLLPSTCNSQVVYDPPASWNCLSAKIQQIAIGGFFSFERSLRNLVVASSWPSASLENTPVIISSASYETHITCKQLLL